MFSTTTNTLLFLYLKIHFVSSEFLKFAIDCGKMKKENKFKYRIFIDTIFPSKQAQITI